MKRIFLLSMLVLLMTSQVSAQLYEQQISASSAGDQTIALGRYRIGTLIDINLSISGGWAEDGGSYQIAADWGGTPRVIFRSEGDIGDRLKFYGYKESNAYAYIFATWDNQSPGENEINELKFYISSNTEFNINLTGSFANAVELVNDFSISTIGNVGIGTTSPTHKLSVNGMVRSKEVMCDNDNWPDYVFTDSYELRSLDEVSAFIKANGHLPNIPSAQEVASNGIKLSEMSASLLEKVEELTLYTISQEKQIKELTEQNKQLKNQEALIQTLIERIENLEK